MLHPISAAVLLLLSAAPSTPLPSDPTGIYAILDKVVLMPDDKAPERIELHGLFCVAEGNYGDYYAAPRRGTVAFTRGDKPDEALAQWRDLASRAGTGRVVAFSSRYAQAEMAQQLTVTAPGQAPAEPVPFPEGWGVHDARSVDYGAALELKLMPTPLAPIDTAAPRAVPGKRPAQQVTFECANCALDQQGLRYVFEVEMADGERFASPAIAPGDKTTTWTTMLSLGAGERVVWRVHVLHPKAERTPVASASFVVGQPAPTRGK